MEIHCVMRRAHRTAWLRAIRLASRAWFRDRPAVALAILPWRAWLAFGLIWQANPTPIRLRLQLARARLRECHVCPLYNRTLLLVI